MGLRSRLAGEGQLLGTFVQSSDPAVSEFVGRLGFDLLCIEGEHSAIGPETVDRLVAACEVSQVPALVRVAGNDPIAIGKALDAGAEGVVVPRIDGAADAAAAVAATRFPPAGTRGFGPSRASRYGVEMASYLERANDELLLVVQVETKGAVEQIDDLLAVEGVDLFLVAPGDLACSLGITDPASPELREVMAGVLAKAKGAGRRSGVFAATVADALAWRRQGAQLVLLGSDLMWLARGAMQALGEVAAGAAAE